MRYLLILAAVLVGTAATAQPAKRPTVADCDTGRAVDVDCVSIQRAYAADPARQRAVAAAAAAHQAVVAAAWVIQEEANQSGWWGPMTLGPNCGRVRAPDLHLRDLEATHARLVPGGPPLSVRVVERGVLEGGGRAAGQYVVLESSASWMRGQPRRLFLTTDRLRCEGERATDRLEERYGRSFR